jgi:hypothetical protein
MSKRRRTRRATARRASAGRRGPPLGLLVGLGALAIVAAVALGWWLLRAREQAATESAAAVIGGTMGCRNLPAFTDRLGYTDRLAVSTSEQDYAGLVIFDGRVPLDADPAERDIHQEPSWDDAGTLGPFVLDRAGDIYTAPVPRTAVSDTPAGSLNTIYRVDGDTGELAPFLTLPGAADASSENPFGILGITYDCDANALYVSTVAGSDRQTERGKIVRVDLATKTVTDEVVDIDAIGLAVFQGRNEKRLYVGLARSAEVGSVALDSAGHATGEFRSDIALDELSAPFGEPRVRRVSFEQATMTLYVVPFSFTLRAVSDLQQVTVRYGYDAERDAWVEFPAVN